MNRSIAHLSWATWSNRSRLLICHEQPERLAHGSSFFLSNLSNLLTVAHLSWVIWANRSQLLIWFERNERMSEFPALLCTDTWCSRTLHTRFSYTYVCKYLSLPGGKNWVWRHHNASLISHLSRFSLKHAFTVEPHKTINKISKKYPTPHLKNLMFILLYSIGLYVWRVDCRLIICLLCHRYFHFMYTILQYSIVQSADLPTLARGCTNLCALQNL